LASEINLSAYKQDYSAIGDEHARNSLKTMIFINYSTDSDPHSPC
jgi:hypothetical protein